MPNSAILRFHCWRRKSSPLSPASGERGGGEGGQHLCKSVRPFRGVVSPLTLTLSPGSGGRGESDCGSAALRYEVRHMGSEVSATARQRLAERLQLLPVQARRLLCVIVRQAYPGTLRSKAPGTATMPEVHEACGLDVDELY